MKTGENRAAVGPVKVVACAVVVLVVVGVLVSGFLTGWTWSFRKWRDPEGLNEDLLHAVEERDLAAARRFLRMGADPDVRKCHDVPARGVAAYRRDWRPLHVAMELGEVEIAAALLDYGADVNAPSHGGETPLHIAAGFPRLDAVELLILKGADVNARSAYGVTPLHYAVHRGVHGMVGLLIKKGADVNARTEFGATPLHTVSNRYLRTSPTYAHPCGVNDNRAVRIVAALIEHGADVNAEDSDGWTPLDFALSFRRDPIAAFLRAYRAKTGGEPTRQGGH